MEINFTINGNPVTVDVEPMMPLLWVVRDELGLKGTKYGCGRAMCGACSLHVDGDLFRSCSYPVKNVDGKEVTTLEGLSESAENLHPIQQAWIETNVPQCGYCQSGQIMQAAALLEKNENPSREEIVNHMNGVLCRCGTYMRIIKAIERATNER